MSSGRDSKLSHSPIGIKIRFRDVILFRFRYVARCNSKLSPVLWQLKLVATASSARPIAIKARCVEEMLRCVEEMLRCVEEMLRCVEEMLRCVEEILRCVEEMLRCVEEMLRCV
eukprot:g68281.t1